MTLKEIYDLDQQVKDLEGDLAVSRTEALLAWETREDVVAHVRCCEQCGAVLDDDQEEYAYCENCEQAMRVASRVIGIDRRQKRLVLE